MKKQLRLDLYHDADVEAQVSSNGLVLTSNFDLLGKHDDMVVADPEGSPPHHYRWTREEGLKPIE